MFSAPAPALPIELFHEIISHIPSTPADQETFRRCCYVNKAFCKSARPRLWAELNIEEPTDLFAALSDPVPSSVDLPPIVSLVQSLTVDVSLFRLDDHLDHFDNPQTTRFATRFAAFVDELSRLLRRLDASKPHLFHALRLHSGLGLENEMEDKSVYTPTFFYWGDIIEPVQTALVDLMASPGLRTLHVSEIRAFPFASLIGAPDARHLLCLGLTTAYFPNNEPGYLAQPPPPANLRSIRCSGFEVFSDRKAAELWTASDSGGELVSPATFLPSLANPNSMECIKLAGGYLGGGSATIGQSDAFLRAFPGCKKSQIELHVGEHLSIAS